MNKLWIFGDSFSDGCGLHDTHPYFLFLKENLKQDNFTKYSWQELLSKELNMELKECAISGCSNTEIITQLLLNFNNFEKDDLIIVGWTLPERLALPTPSNHYYHLPIISINNDHNAREVDIDSNHQSKYEDLYKNVLIPNLDAHTHFWTKVGTELIKNISKNFNLKSWLWYGMEIDSIFNHTNEVVKDDHPSLKGHVQIKDFIKKLDVGTIYDWNYYFKLIKEPDMHHPDNDTLFEEPKHKTAKTLL